ncbi:MAG: peptidase E [Burkholderiales bacterium]|nr:peptidase E [Burkholderiales bacterium]
MARPRQLIVLGGGGFSMEDSPALDRYFLDATGKARPRICFLPTASGDSVDMQLKFYRAHARFDCVATHLSLFRPPGQPLDELLLTQDAIFVGGGNTRAMLALWREWSLDTILRAAYDAGVVIGGISAGMNCWFETCLSDSSGQGLAPLPGLGWLPGGACPHYDGEADRRPTLRTLIAQGHMPASWAADDGAALHFVDEQAVTAVASRPDAHVWRVERDSAQQWRETRFPTQYLVS